MRFFPTLLAPLAFALSGCAATQTTAPTTAAAPAQAAAADEMTVIRPAPDVAARLPEKLRRFLFRERPVEMRPVEPIDFLSPKPRPPVEHIWFKVCDRLPDDHRLHACLLAYMSDFNLLNTATQPHAGKFPVDELTMASIDHAMWFHREVRADEWLLYSIDSPSASGARGFARGSVFDRDGALVASTAQEGLIRVSAPRRKAQ